MTPSASASAFSRRVSTKVPFAFAAVFTAVAAAIPQGQAADVFWDGTTGPFTTGTNWSTDVVPGNTDNAIIDNGGTAQIQTGDAVAVSRLLLSNGTIAQTGGTTSTVPFGTYESPGAYAIGNVTGQTGTYNISGSSALSGGRVRVGSDGGTGVVTISNTASYNGGNNQDTWIGSGTGGVGSLTMTDSSTWTANNDWIVIGRGPGANGTLTMSGTTQLKTLTGGNVVFSDGGTSTGNISGGASIAAAGEFWVGNGGTANVTVSDTATVSSTSWVAIGRNGGNGTLTMSGTTQINKPSGGGNFIVADGTNSVGTLTLNAGTSSTINSELWIGNGGNATGTVNLNGGSISVNNWVAIGRATTGTGILNVSAGSITKTGNGNFIMNGKAGSQINQTGGAINVNAGETWLSENNDRSSAWTASGGTASLSVLKIGLGGQGTMTISGTANYTATTVSVGTNASGNGTLNLNGGTFTANSIAKGTGTGVVNFNGGTLRAGAASATFVTGVTANVLAGGIKVDTNSFNDTITVTLSGIGGLTKLGAGTLTLNGAQGYTGDTSILGGTLSINTLYLADSSNVTINNGSVFDLGTAGSDTIHYLIINGVLQAAGTYGAIGSGAQFETSAITGTGFLVAAVPEPEHYALGIGALLGAMIVLRRRRAANA